MAKKKRATADDLPSSEPPTDTSPDQIWDPSGNRTTPEDSGADHAGDDPDLREFLQAINAAKDPETEFLPLNADHQGKP